MKLLLVCLGNICRSPMAAAAMRHLAAAHPVAARWVIDSAGTGHWHVGRGADRRACATLRRHGIDSGHCARQVQAADFTRFDRILAMDGENLATLQRLRPDGATAVVELLGDYDPEGVREVADPYYGEDDGFETTWRHVERCCRAFLARHAD